MIDHPLYLHVAGYLLLSDKSPAIVHELCTTARIGLFMMVVRCYAGDQLIECIATADGSATLEIGCHHELPDLLPQLFAQRHAQLRERHRG